MTSQCQAHFRQVSGPGAEAPASWPIRAAEPGLWVSILLSLVYALIIGTISLLRYINFHGGDDIVYYAQLLWNTAHGRLLQVTFGYPLANTVHGIHVEPLLLLLALPYRLAPDPRTLLVLQTLVLACGGPLVYLLARTHGHAQRTGVLLTAFYCCSPFVQYANIHEFHLDPFAVPPLFGALIAFDCRRWRLLAVCLVVTLLVKEQLVLFVAGMGLYWWLARGNRRVGLASIAAALLYGLLVILPWFALTATAFTHEYTRFFADATGAGETAHGPAAVLRAAGHILGDSRRWSNIVLALLPTGLLCFLDTSAIILLLPLAGLFVGNSEINAIWFHHYVTMAPIVLYATSRFLARRRVAPRAGPLALGMLTWTLLLGYLYAAQPICMMHWIYQPAEYLADRHTRAQAAIVRAAPSGASLAADMTLGAHLANRTYLYRLWDARDVLLASYVLLDLHSSAPPAVWLRTATDTYMSGPLKVMGRVGGYRIAASVPREGLYLYANCRRFPRLAACAGH